MEFMDSEAVALGVIAILGVFCCLVERTLTLSAT